MTALIPAPNVSTFNVSPQLWHLLSSGPSINTNEIAESPELKEEASHVSRSLAVLAEPGGVEMVQRALAPLVLVFGLGEQSEAPAFWKAYNDVLSGLPRLALDRAVLEYNAKGKFFPKPAELKELADPHAFAIRQAASRARKASEMETGESKRDQRTPEEIEAVGKMLADYLAVVKEKTPPEPKRHATRGPVDGGGVTNAGRAIIERMKER